MLAGWTKSSMATVAAMGVYIILTTSAPALAQNGIDPVIGDAERRFVLPPQLPKSMIEPTRLTKPASPAAASGNAASSHQNSVGNSAVLNDTPLVPATSALTKGFADTALYKEAVSAIEGKRPDSVLAELVAVEADYAGDAAYDYVYGVCLLDTGNAPAALYPLLRAAEQQPRDYGLKLDLGRAFFATGENESARAIFRELAASKPPPAAAQIVASYLTASDTQAKRYEKSWRAELGVSGGFDTNANGATSLKEFIGFALDQDSRSTQSSFGALDGRLELGLPLAARLRFELGGYAQTREFAEAGQFSTVQAGLNSGLRYRSGDWELGLSLQASQSLVDGENNGRYSGATAQWRYRLGALWSTSASAKYGLTRFENLLQIRDVNQELLSVAITRQLNLARGSELSFSALAGDDEAQQSGSPYGRDLIGAGVQFISQLNLYWVLDLNTQFLSSEYVGNFFGLPRNDDLLSAGLRLTFQHPRRKQWRIGAVLNYADNKSDIAIYSYDRMDMGLRLSRRFQ